MNSTLWKEREFSSKNKQKNASLHRHIEEVVITLSKTLIGKNMKTITITNLQEIEKIIHKCPYCTVGIIDLKGEPYVVPMNFAYKDGTIYLHSGPEGSKVEMVTLHPQVCITFCEGHELVYMHKQIACSYSMKSRSVICRGKVKFIEEMTEKRRILDTIMKQYTENECGYSEPAVRNVKIWEVKVEHMTCKSFGLRPSDI